VDFPTGFRKSAISFRENIDSEQRCGNVSLSLHGAVTTLTTGKICHVFLLFSAYY